MTPAEPFERNACLTREDLTAPRVGSTLIALVWLTVLGLMGPVGYWAPMGLLLGGGSAWVVFSAMRGCCWALAGLLGFSLVVPNIDFMPQGLNEAASLNAQTGLKLALWASMGLVGMARLPQLQPLLRDRAILSIGMFALIAIASTLWSPTPVYSAAGSIGFLTALLFACAVAAELPEDRLYRTVVGSFVIYVALNMVAAIALPDIAWLPNYGDSGSSRLQGVSSHPNILGKEMATFICLCLPLALVRGQRRAAFFLTSLAFLIIVATQSRTSMGATLLCLSLPFLLRPEVAKRLTALVLVVAGLALLAIAMGFVPDLRSILDGASRTSDASEILTLTGRTELWGFVWDKILEVPLLGHGFGSAEAVLSLQWWGAPDAGVGAHNTWLQSLLIVGALGTIPFIWFHMELLLRLRAERPSMTRFLSSYLLILGLTEVEIAAHPVMLTIATFLLVALDARRMLVDAEHA